MGQKSEHNTKRFVWHATNYYSLPRDNQTLIENLLLKKGILQYQLDKVDIYISTI